MTIKAHPIRVPEDLAAEAKLVAKGRGVSFNTLVVESLQAEIERARSDPEFMEALQSLIEEDREILDRLAGQ